MRQPGKDVINRIESWWGAPFDLELVNLIAAAPIEHIREFQHSSPRESTDHPELWDFDVPTLEVGELRPALQDYDGLSGLSSLLYSDSALLSSWFLQPLIAVHHWSEDEDEDFRYGFRHGLLQLLDLRPLIEKDLIYFTNLHAMGYQLQDYLRGNLLSVDDFWNYRFPEGMSREEAALAFRSSQLAAIENRAAQRQCTPIALNAQDAQVIANWRSSTSVDRRPQHLTTLLNISVPHVHASTKDIASLRSNDSALRIWRDNLKMALDAVGQFEPTTEAIEEARAIVGGELRGATERLRASFSTSPAMGLLKAGVKGFALSSISTAAVEATVEDDPWKIAIQSAAAGAVGGALAASTSWGSVKDARLLDRLALSFQSAPTSAPA